MKCLTIREPYASLIKNNLKHIETRSWNTTYRGKLYIHAGVNKVPKNLNKDLQKLIKDLTFSYGEIICECELTDVIYMTKEYVDEIKNNHYEEYICGDFQVGRYAWILKNVKPLNVPIKTKGRLSIWNYYTEEEIFNILKDIEYGWLDKNKEINYEVNDLFQDNYILQSPKEVLKNKVGVCWDQVELERYLFKNTDLEFKTYFIIHYAENYTPTHTFLVYKKDNSYYWFEHSWLPYQGIHKYPSLEKLLLDVKNKFIQDMLDNKYEEDNLYVYEYLKPKYHLNSENFCEWAENGCQVDI